MTIAFWATVALLLAGALLFVLPPLLRPAHTHSGPSPLTAYREQRAELDAQFASGAIGASDHARALRELEGRVVEEVGDAKPESGPMREAPLLSIVAIALLVPAGALALYGVVGRPAALQPASPQAEQQQSAPHTMSREEMEDMVERLAEKLQKQPNDADGWHMLARSYVAFNRMPEAAQAYERAAKLSPGDPQVLADFADTLAMLNGRNLEGRPLELINAALKADPKHAKSLMLLGTAAFNRGEYAAAAATWQTLLDSLPPGAEQAKGVAASLAQAQQRAGTAVATAAPTAKPQAEAAAGVSIDGTVTLSDALKARVPAGATLYVFARAVDGPRMPLAIVRVPAGGFPFTFKLDDTSAMSPQFKLSSQPQVMLAARISPSGNATPQSGDLMGTLGPVKVGANGVKLVIDGVVP